MITPEMVTIAKERPILSRATHLDQLADKLSEDRVRRVIEPLLTGDFSRVVEDDTEYCRDLGLITKGPRGLRIANSIYREVIPRELSKYTQDQFLAVFEPDWITDDGSTLFRLFQAFWHENSEIWKDDMAGYLEAAPHLIFQAFLQRVANGNGFVGREFAYGSRRADLVLTWRSDQGEQRIVIELKLLTEREPYERVKAKALEQTDAYADSCDTSEAHVIVFDRTGKRSWSERVFTELCEHNGRAITIWAM